MDSPNTESVWPSLLLNTEKNIMRIIISRNLWFQWVGGISVCGRNPITYSNESYFSVVLLITEAPVVLFVVLFKVVVTFQSVDEILCCDHSNESYSWAVLSSGTVYYSVQGGSNFWVCGWNPMVWPFKWKLLSSTFLGYCLLCCTRWFQLFSPWMKTCGVGI